MRSRSICFAVALITLLRFAASAQQPTPNVVFILTDNHGAWTLGCYGNKDIRTPNIDRLAREGSLMERCFSSNGVCSPTRATWLTGLMPSQHGVHCFISGEVQRGPKAINTIEEFRSLPEILASRGYTCGLSGKWHLGDQLRPHEGFSFWITKAAGSTSEFYNQLIVENGELREEPSYLTDFWTQRGIEFIEQNQQRPFFLYLAYNGPYGLSPLLLNEARNRHAAYYADKELPSFPREQMHPWLNNNRDYLNNPTSMRRYAAEISGVDDGVGRIMQTLERLGLDDKTLVVFAADQGLAGGHSGIWGMGDHTVPESAFDSTMHVPLIWRHPGRVAAGRRVKDLVSNYDFYPSLLEYLAIEDAQPDGVPRPGRSYVAQLQPSATTDGVTSPHAPITTEAWDNTVFYEFEVIRAVRTDDWKYVEHVDEGPRELYDLRHDPGELTNLINAAEHAEVQQQLRRRVAEYFAVYADPKYDFTKGRQSKAVRIHADVPPRVGPSLLHRTFTLDPTLVVLQGEHVDRSVDLRSLVGWKNADDQAIWTFGRAVAGRYEVQAVWSLADSNTNLAGNQFVIEIDGREIMPKSGDVKSSTGRVAVTGSWTDFQKVSLGEITLTEGDHELVFRPAGEVAGEWLHLRSVILSPIATD